MSGNKINSNQQDTITYNKALERLDLKENNLTAVHPSTIRNNSRLRHIDMLGNKINLRKLALSGEVKANSWAFFSDFNTKVSGFR